MSKIRTRRVRTGRVRAARTCCFDVDPVRTVDEIENLRPELQALRTAEPEVLEERDVPLLLARIVEPVPRRVAERPLRGRGEGRRVEEEILIRDLAFARVDRLASVIL